MLFLDMICSEKRSVCQERRSCKPVCFDKQVIAKNKDQCILSTPKRGLECSYAGKFADIYNVFHTVDTTQVLKIGENHLGRVIGCDNKGYQMGSFNLKVLVKFGLCSNCSQKLHGCSLARVRKIFTTARMLAFPLTCA